MLFRHAAIVALFWICACTGASDPETAPSEPITDTEDQQRDGEDTDGEDTDGEDTDGEDTDAEDPGTDTDDDDSAAEEDDSGDVPCDLEDVERAPGNNWSDSYSVDGKCYCATTYDHNIADIEVNTPAGVRTVRQICEAIGPGPGQGDNPVYNDVQCGNGPANDAGDEDWCPGRVDQGIDGCCTIGPKWDLSVVR
ncbi:MAG: hypothetical protein AAFV53_21835 [Myxococcota bacterium]